MSKLLGEKAHKAAVKQTKDKLKTMTKVIFESSKAKTLKNKEERIVDFPDFTDGEKAAAIRVTAGHLKELLDDVMLYEDKIDSDFFINNFSKRKFEEMRQMIITVEDALWS